MNTDTLRQGERRRAQRRQAGAVRERSREDTHSSMKMGSYGRLAAMVSVSTLLGWAAMYLNVYALDHVFFSWTRLFMALIMGGVMAAVMMLFMWGMYPNRKANFAVLAVAAFLFCAGVALVRSQATVDDVSWMKAMIPHHSIAVLTSSRARIDDPRARALADSIIATQQREIAEMKQLIQELQDR